MLNVVTYLTVIIAFKLGRVCKRYFKPSLFIAASFAIGYIAWQSYPEFRAFFDLENQLAFESQSATNARLQLAEANVKLEAAQKVIADLTSKADNSKKNDVKLVVEIAALQDKLELCQQKRSNTVSCKDANVVANSNKVIRSSPTEKLRWAGFCFGGTRVGGTEDVSDVPVNARRALIEQKANGACNKVAFRMAFNSWIVTGDK